MKKNQHGVFLVEALIAILIFSLGVLGMVAMGGMAISAQSDAQYRTDAANYANEIAAAIALDIAPGNYSTSLPEYANLPIIGGASVSSCVFAGATSTKQVVTDWVARVTGAVDPKRGLPGATVATTQIMVDTSPAAHNKVTITVCWLPPSSAAVGPYMHSHTLITYIN